MDINDVPFSVVERALLYAIAKHEGQFRKNGLPYITHPIAVADLVYRFKGDSRVINSLMAAAYLHDVIEDTGVTYEELISEFGSFITSLVRELTDVKETKDKIGKVTYQSFKLQDMSSWALVIKLCDRLHNISDLDTVDEIFRNKVISETKIILSHIKENRYLSGTHMTIIDLIEEEIVKYQTMHLTLK